MSSAFEEGRPEPDVRQVLQGLKNMVVLDADLPIPPDFTASLFDMLDKRGPQIRAAIHEKGEDLIRQMGPVLDLIDEFHPPAPD